MPLSLLLLAAGAALLGLAAWLLEWKPTVDAPLFWRKWSTWLAAANAALWAHITATSGLLLGFAMFIPPYLQTPVVIGVFIVGWVIPVIAAHVRQEKIVDKVIEQEIKNA